MSFSTSQSPSSRSPGPDLAFCHPPSWPCDPLLRTTRIGRAWSSKWDERTRCWHRGCLRSSLRARGGRGLVRLRGGRARRRRGIGCGVRGLSSGCCPSVDTAQVNFTCQMYLHGRCICIGRHGRGWGTSGLAWRASTSSCEKRTGVSLGGGG